MPDLPPRPDLDQLRHQAKDLLRNARHGVPEAVARIAAGSGHVRLASAQLAVARDHGFPSWPRLVVEIERRSVLDHRDVGRLTAMLADDPTMAVCEMENWCDHQLGAAPLNYVAMMRCDTANNVWRDVPGTGPMARALLDAGAPVNGNPGESETPLMTAASYGDAEVAQVLVDAGADLEAVSSPDAGGVPNATALRHAAVFGMTGVVDVLVTAGVRVADLVLAAAAGDVSAHLRPDSPHEDLVRALMMAADHQRLDVIDQLIAAGTPVEAVDERWDRHPLRLAAGNGRPASVRRLLAHGADPNLRDAAGRTPLDLCRAARPAHLDTAGRDEVESILVPLTRS